MFITTYQVYHRWHPAEGGCMLRGNEIAESVEFNNEADARDYLKKVFSENCEYFKFEDEDIIVEQTEWGVRHSVDKDGVRMVLVLKEDKPLTEDYHVDDYGDEYEDYNSYIIYRDEEDEFEVYPETVKGIHKEYAEYC